jgi:predicted O-methyltransferase YrrM
MAETLEPGSTLRNDAVRAVLDRLHAESRTERLRYVAFLPRLVLGRLSGRSFGQTITPGVTKNLLLAISREQGELLYLTARAIGASRIVEFGTSFGVSILYLAAAVRDSGGDVVIGTELEPSKHARAVSNLEEAGLGDVAEVRLGDALETLKEVPEPIDMVLLDGWKDLYLPVLELLKPRLRRGAVVLADNIFTFRKSLRPYVDYVQSGRNGFLSTTLKISDGFEYSYFIG